MVSGTESHIFTIVQGSCSNVLAAQGLSLRLVLSLPFEDIANSGTKVLDGLRILARAIWGILDGLMRASATDVASIFWKKCVSALCR